MRSLSNSSYSCFDGALLPGNGKNKKGTALFLSVAFLFFLLAGSAQAETTGPRWVITSTSDPTNIAPNSPATEVLDITIDATGGTFTLGASGKHYKTEPMPYDATAEEVDVALGEAVSEFKSSGGAKLAVTGGPGAYVVTYEAGTSVGDISYGGQNLEPITADGSGLTGGAHTATVSVVSTGESSPRLTLTAINVGGSSTDGGPVTIADTLPAGFTAVAGNTTYHGYTATGMQGIDAYHFNESVEGAAQPKCVTAPVIECTFLGVHVDPGDNLIVGIDLAVAGPPEVTEGQSVVNHASVAGGGAAPAFADSPLTISSAPAAYGIVPGSLVAALSSTQAGAHANITTAFTLTTGPFEYPVFDPKDVEFDVPLGLVGDAVGAPQCTQARLEEGGISFASCPADTQVGTATLTLRVDIAGGSVVEGSTEPVYNIAPAPGEPAAFEFLAFGKPIRLDASVLSDGDYGVRVTAPNIDENGGALYSAVTIWGVPGEHNGPGPDETAFKSSFGGPGTGARTAFLSNPTQCSQPLSSTLLTDSWAEPGVFPVGPEGNKAPSGTMTGCDALPFFTSVSMVPDTFQAGAPAGYAFDLKVDRSADATPEGDATPDVKNVSTTLPLGTVISPSAANGLGACKDDPEVNPALVPNEFGLKSLELASCSIDSQVGTVEITSPDIAERFGGAVYLAEPECNPCSPKDAEDGKMVKLLLQAKGKGEGGVLVKVTGWLSVNQQTGQLTATFANNPQLPFSDLELKLAGGPRATLANPRVCGPATTSVDLTPWSTPFTPDAIDTSTYQVTGCQGHAVQPVVHR